ncbi:hypothetical protein scyTo_0023057, partial [Scyliorhinus torazame]|nr:hypothetical protein [Scyliorhinus torazame]
VNGTACVSVCVCVCVIVRRWDISENELGNPSLCRYFFSDDYGIVGWSPRVTSASGQIKAVGGARGF